MVTKKTTVTKKAKTVTESKVKPIVQVNPVVQRIQTVEGWKRSQTKLRMHKKTKAKG